MKKYLDHGYRIVKPLVNYALGWLSPELLGTGFHIKTASDNRIVGQIPYSKLNCDHQAQLHLGLVVNSGLELVRQMLSRHLGHNYFQIQNLNMQIKKENVWNKDLALSLDVDDVIFDRFCIELQKNEQAPMGFEILIQGPSKIRDKIQFDLLIKSKKLLT